MPKLDGTHILERLTKRIEKLEAGDEIADKEICSLLNDAQRAELDGAWEPRVLSLLLLESAAPLSGDRSWQEEDVSDSFDNFISAGQHPMR